MTGDLFPAASTADVTTARKIEELERELRLREKVYPRWVAAGRLQAVEAEARLLALRAILEDYREERLVAHALGG